MVKAETKRGRKVENYKVTIDNYDILIEAIDNCRDNLILTVQFTLLAPNQNFEGELETLFYDKFKVFCQDNFQESDIFFEEKIVIVSIPQIFRRKVKRRNSYISLYFHKKKKGVSPMEDDLFTYPEAKVLEDYGLFLATEIEKFITQKQ